MLCVDVLKVMVSLQMNVICSIDASCGIFEWKNYRRIDMVFLSGSEFVHKVIGYEDDGELMEVNIICMEFVVQIKDRNRSF